MREYQEKNKRKEILYSKPALFLLFFLFAFLAFSAAKMFLKSREISAKSTAEQKILAELTQRKNELEAEINRLKSQTGLEEEVRNKFNVVKPGEKILVITDSEKDKKSDIIPDAGQDGTFSRFWKWVKGE